ncbi:MAG: PIG-L family deacetylase [Chloroflexi bacterium]|nr:PIG-L family deacetylase [Chloroflexota bacterium]
MPIKLEVDAEKPLRILVIVAHPDDIEFGAAGSVARWTDHGATVTYCIVTDGAAGSNDPNVRPADLIKQRQQEQREAAEMAGVHDVRFLGFADGTLEPTMELRRQLTRLIRELKPDRVVIMDPTTILVENEQFDYINHPDHRASGEAALYAVFPSAETRPIFSELLAEALEPHHVTELYFNLTPKPNIAVDITDYADRKIQALLRHRSQLDESVVDMVRSWDKEAGKEVGVEYAEVFRVMRFPVNVPGIIQPETDGDKPT